MMRECSRAISTTPSSAERGIIAPVGFCGLLGNYKQIFVLPLYIEDAYFKIISLVFGFIRDFNSSRSKLHFSCSRDRQRLTSAPIDAGTEYSCW